MLDALSYLLLNSTLLISVCALVFFLLGLWLGRLLWGARQDEAQRLSTALRAAQTQVADTQDALAACQKNARATEATLAACKQSLAERAAAPPARLDPVPLDPDQVDDRVAELRKQLDKTGSDLEIARSEAMQLADRLSESKREVSRLRNDNQRLDAELQRVRPQASAATEPTAMGLTSVNASSGAAAHNADDLPSAWAAFTAELDAGNARVDDDLGLLFDAPPAAADDLTRIKGIATVLNRKLNDFGVYTYRQIAGWDESVVGEFSKRLSFKDRVQRDDWVGQARRLHSEINGEALD